MTKEHDTVAPMIQQLFAKDENPETVKWAIAGSIYLTLLLVWLPMPDGRADRVAPKPPLSIEDFKHATLNVAKPLQVERVNLQIQVERRPVPVQQQDRLEMPTLNVMTEPIDAVSSPLSSPDWDFTTDVAPPRQDNSLNRPLPSDYPGLEKPIFTVKVPPNYPTLAARNKQQGTVLLKAILRQDGTIDQIEVMRQLAGGKFGFEKAAIEAVKQWRFLPGKLNGNPVDIEVHLEISFILN